MSEIRVTSVVGENGGDPVGLTTGLTVGPLTGTTGIGVTITHQGHAQFAGVCTATSFAGNVTTDKIIPTAGVPSGGGGGIIQVVSSTKTDISSGTVTNTSDWTGHGLSVTITPKFSTSKILITGFISIGFDTSENIWYRLFKGGSELTGSIGNQVGSNRKRATAGTYFKGDNWAISSIPINYLDTAGSTSALTYTPAFNQFSSSNKTLYVNSTASQTDSASYPTLVSTMTAMEVSA